MRKHVYRVDDHGTEYVTTLVGGLECIRTNDVFFMCDPTSGIMLSVNGENAEALFGVATDNGYFDPSLDYAVVACDGFSTLENALELQLTRMVRQ